MVWNRADVGMHLTKLIINFYLIFRRRKSEILHFIHNKTYFPGSKNPQDKGTYLTNVSNPILVNLSVPS